MPHSLLVAMSIWATSPLGVVIRCIFCLFFFFFFPSWLALWDSRTQHRPAGERASWCLETSPLSWLPPCSWVSTLTLLSLFLSYILSSSFQREWAAFWVPGVLRQCSEVVFWNFLSVQMVFWWICGRERVLPVLFLRHLRTAPQGHSKAFL